MNKLIALVTLLASLALIGWSPNWPKCQTDYQCLNDCTSMGYSYGYCKQICTWCEN